MPEKFIVTHYQEEISKVLSTPLPDLGYGYPLDTYNAINIPEATIDQTIEWVVNKKMQEPDENYRDAYNALVCMKLDSMLTKRLITRDVSIEDINDQRLRQEGRLYRQETGISNKTMWAIVDSMVKQDIADSLTYFDREQHVVFSGREKVKDSIAETLEFGASYVSKLQIDDPEKEKMLVQFASLWLFVSETQPYPLTDKNTIGSVRRQLAESFFQGKDLTLCTFVCLTYTHQQVSEPGTVRVDPGPIERREGRASDDIDAFESFGTTVEILRSYLGERVKPFAILSNVDLIEVFKTTDASVLKDAEEYWVKQYQPMCEQLGIISLSFNDEVRNNATIADTFQKGLSDIRQHISEYVSAQYLEESVESIYQYYNTQLGDVSMTREAARENTIDKFAVYGLQPAVLRLLFPGGFTFISTEWPVRDAMYAIRDKKQNILPMPIIYSMNLSQLEKKTGE